MSENVAAPEISGEAAPLTNPEATTPTAETTPATQPEQVFTLEEAKEIKTFLDSNGGLEKVRKNLTARQADLQPQAQPQAPSPTPASQPTPTPAPTVEPQPQPQAAPVSGGISTEEFMVQQYFESLAKREEYSNIASQIRSGEVLKEMQKFNIQPMVNGRFNDQQVRDYLDLYAKTVPASPAAAPVTTTPTVDYIQVPDNTITSSEQAIMVLSQDRELRANGREGHPLAAAANEFFDKAMKAQNTRGRYEHTTLDEARKK